MIVKVILGNLGDRPLAFVKDKSVVQEIHVTPPLAAKLGKDRKAYFKAEFTDGGRTLDIGDRVEDQGW
jgi:hypothetical protein